MAALTAGAVLALVRPGDLAPARHAQVPVPASTPARVDDRSPVDQAATHDLTARLVALLPVSAVIVTTVFALVYPYLNAYYGEVGLPLADVGANPVDVFWKFSLAAVYHSAGGAPLLFPLLAIAVTRIPRWWIRVALVVLALGLLALLGPRLLAGFPRVLTASWLLAVPAAVLAVRGRPRAERLRRTLRRTPRSLSLLALLVLWGAVAIFGNAQGRQDVTAFLDAPAAEIPPRTLLERLSGVTSGRLVELVRAPDTSPVAELDGVLVRRIAFADGYTVLFDLRECLVWRAPSEHIALVGFQPRPGDAVVAAYPRDGCHAVDALVPGN